MAALDFPASPTNGQVYGQYTYDSTKGAWRVTAANGATAVASPTAPTSPVAGNLWYNTNDGIMFMYYADGDSSQWVEVKANSSLGSTVPARVDALELADASTNKSGLVPVVPTSVTVGAGVATVGTNGVISVTTGGMSYIRLNGVFTGNYTNYRVIVNHKGTDANVDWVYFRLSSAGTDNTGGYYYWGSSGWVNNTGGASGVGNLYGGSVSNYGVGYTSQNFSGASITLEKPYQASFTNIISDSSCLNTGNNALYSHVSTGTHASNTSYDGINIYYNNSQFAAGSTIQVYGYR